MEQLKERAVALTRDLVRIKSEAPPGNERPVAEFIVEYLKKHGVEGSVVPVGEDRANVMAVLKGNRPGKTLLYQGHIDVVPAVVSEWSIPPYEGVIRDGKLYGRGSADMKSGVAAMIEATLWLKRNKVPLAGDLVLGFVADEEVSNKGTYKMLNDGLQADFCVISEPTSLDIVLGHRGVLAMEVTFLGKSVHSAQWHTGINAITKAVDFINRTREFYDSILSKKSHPLLGPPTLNVAVIDGGKKFNVIPDQCRIELDRRILVGESRESCERELQSILDDLATCDPDFKTQTKTLTYCPPSMISPDAEIVRCLREAGKKVLGTVPQETAFKATCEASLLQPKSWIICTEINRVT
jgi:acetylornithine deacetylase/succinyl-diaminopimelate desuccinylase family protein